MNPHYEMIKVSIRNAKAAQIYQENLLKSSQQKLIEANYDPNRLETPIYDIEKQSCATHVFDVLRAGGRVDAPLTSPIGRVTGKYFMKLKKESKELKL